MNFGKFIRTPFVIEHPWRLLLIKVNLVGPSTFAILERSFSTLKRAKTSILPTVTDSRLNHTLLILIYKEN